MEEETESTIYLCYQCSKFVHPIMEVESIKCSLCQGIFVDQMHILRSDHRHHQNEGVFSGDSRYLRRLLVFGKEPLDESHRSDSSQSEIVGSDTFAKIKAALKLLTFREELVLVQFQSPCASGKHQTLTTLDRPYGLGAEDQRLLMYRKDSECSEYVMDKDHEEDELSPSARVFRRGLPEWTPDLTNSSSKYFLQQDSAVRCNLHGYLALPVFDSDSDSDSSTVVGVLEFLMSSSYTSYAFEVQQVHMALKTENLRSPQAFGFPTSKDPNELRQNELHRILDILKSVSDIHHLPLAQTWAISPTSSFVSHENVIEKSCSSFDTRCIGKACMYTSSLPFCVRDLDMWQFRKECIVQHLDKSRGFVGRAFLARCSCYCQDVTELSEEEYPLVHFACMSGLTSCFTIFLHSVESNCEFVLEFFLPRVMKDGKYVMNFVQTLKQIIEVASGFELGDTSYIQEVGPHTDVFVNIEPRSMSTSSEGMSSEDVDNLMFKRDSSDSESISSMAETCDTFTDAGETSIPGMVKVKVTFNNFEEEFQSSIPLILSDLKNEVAKRFDLVGKELKLKFMDEDNDLILICYDEDLQLGLDTINLICELDYF